MGTVQSFNLRQGHGTPTRAGIVYIILGVSLGTTPSVVPLLPQHTHPELEGISQVVQASSVHLL